MTKAAAAPALITLCIIISTPPLTLTLDSHQLLGKWQNEEGLFLSINRASEGRFMGTYQTFVAGEVNEYETTGCYDIHRHGHTLAWSVTWSSVLYKSSFCSMAWSGQYREGEEEEDIPKIVATWIMTSDTNRTTHWQSTLIGKTEFLFYEEQERKILYELDK